MAHNLCQNTLTPNSTRPHVTGGGRKFNICSKSTNHLLNFNCSCHLLMKTFARWRAWHAFSSSGTEKKGSVGLRGGDGGGNQRQSGAEEHGEIGEEEKAFMNPNTPLHLLRERDSFAIFHYTFYLTPASQPPSGSISSSIITRCFYVDKFLPAPHHAARRLENACVHACARFVLPFSTLGGKFSLPLFTATHTHTHELGS